ITLYNVLERRIKTISIERNYSRISESELSQMLNTNNKFFDDYNSEIKITEPVIKKLNNKIESVVKKVLNF
ncbi:MAG: hypothetical protein KC414_01795, partial [Romboutsia sp.]|nr:hypothetical protein [Romboutsia sp.]